MHFNDNKVKKKKTLFAPWPHPCWFAWGPCWRGRSHWCPCPSWSTAPGCGQFQPWPCSLTEGAGWNRSSDNEAREAKMRGRVCGCCQSHRGQWRGVAVSKLKRHSMLFQSKNASRQLPAMTTSNFQRYRRHCWHTTSSIGTHTHTIAWSVLLYKCDNLHCDFKHFSKREAGSCCISRKCHIAQ